MKPKSTRHFIDGSFTTQRYSTIDCQSEVQFPLTGGLFVLIDQGRSTRAPTTSTSTATGNLSGDCLGWLDITRAAGWMRGRAGTSHFRNTHSCGRDGLHGVRSHRTDDFHTQSTGNESGDADCGRDTRSRRLGRILGDRTGSTASLGRVEGPVSP